MTYQGRTGLKHTHIFTFSENQLNRFKWDGDEPGSGLKATCDFINGPINDKL